MRKITLFLVLSLAFVICLSDAFADDYFVYATYYPDYTTGGLGACGGYVDADGKEYIYFWDDSGTGYKVEVETSGDPNQHPDNPEAPGPMAPRTFTLISSHNCIADMGVPFSVCDADEYYVDDTGIYLGPGTNGIHKWDHDWNYQGQIGPQLSGAQSLTYDKENEIWYAGLWNRTIYSLSDTDSDGSYMDETWTAEFTHPDYAGSHHDGMEYVKPNLWISDMTSDKIAQWQKVSGVWTEINVFVYSNPAVVEGMGFGPNKHFWITGFYDYYIYEVGGGALQTAIEGIPDQCVLAGDAFDTFDLDDYTIGVPPFTWSWTGNTNIGISVDGENVVTVTYPAGWWGSETVTFTVTDSLGGSASDDAIFTVDPVPVVGDIPDQFAPFVPFDLDDHLSGIDPSQVTWTASGMSCLVVTIDPVTHVATVTNPGEACTEPETITFTATAIACEDTVSDWDDATFTPVLPVAIDIKPQSCPNPFNTKSKGVLPVAILGTEDFDVSTVDPTTVLLEGVAPLRWNFEDVSTPVEPGDDPCECTTEGADGFMDMTLKFDRQAIVAALGMVQDREVKVLTLTGRTYDGMPIEGQDCVRIIHKVKSKLSTEIADGFSLGKNYPNPFNPETDISFSLPERTQVSLIVYNILGERVETLVSGDMDAGTHTIHWNGRDEAGNSVASGIYFYRLKTKSFDQTMKMVLMK